MQLSNIKGFGTIKQQNFYKDDVFTSEDLLKIFPKYIKFYRELKTLDKNAKDIYIRGKILNILSKKQLIIIKSVIDNKEEIITCRLFILRYDKLKLSLGDEIVLSGSMDNGVLMTNLISKGPNMIFDKKYEFKLHEEFTINQLINKIFINNNLDIIDLPKVIRNNYNFVNNLAMYKQIHYASNKDVFKFNLEQLLYSEIFNSFLVFKNILNKNRKLLNTSIKNKKFDLFLTKYKLSDNDFAIKFKDNPISNYIIENINNDKCNYMLIIIYNQILLHKKVYIFSTKKQRDYLNLEKILRKSNISLKFCLNNVKYETHYIYKYDVVILDSFNFTEIEFSPVGGVIFDIDSFEVGFEKYFNNFNLNTYYFTKTNYYGHIFLENFHIYSNIKRNYFQFISSFIRNRNSEDIEYYFNEKELKEIYKKVITDIDFYNHELEIYQKKVIEKYTRYINLKYI